MFMDIKPLQDSQIWPKFINFETSFYTPINTILCLKYFLHCLLYVYWPKIYWCKKETYATK